MAGGKKAQKSKTATGTSTPAVVAEERKGPPVVVGISFGDSYASIAVINKENQPECIANEDGERQIACAISFNGQEIYIGNQAKPQLVKNHQNTITNFRNLLGKKASSLPTPTNTTSAPVIAGASDLPAYTVTYTPSPNTTIPASGTATPKGAAPPAKKGAPAAAAIKSLKSTPLGTPRPSSPQPTQKTITVPEVSSMFLKSLHGSAYDFLGKEIDGAVLICPAHFDAEQRAALKDAAQDAGIKVLGLLDEAGAALLAYEERHKHAHGLLDRTIVVLDVGASSVTVSCMSLKHGMIHTLASVHDDSVGGNAIDDLLINYFAKEFTKKVKVPLSFPEDARAEVKLRLAVEHTKRTLSAGRNTAPCSVESLKEGFDLHSNITRMRFELLVAPVYAKIADKVKECLQKAAVDAVHVDEVLLTGASAASAGLSEALKVQVFTPDDDEDEEDEDEEGQSQKPAAEFKHKTRIVSSVEPYEVFALGAVVHARELASLSDADKAAFEEGSALAKVSCTVKPIVLVFPQEDGSQPWVPLVLGQTPLPCRRLVAFDIDGAAVTRMGFEVWEAEDGVEYRKDGKVVDASEAEQKKGDDDDEEDEPTITKTRVTNPTTKLGAMALDLKAGAETRVLITAQVAVDGAIHLKVAEQDREEHFLEIPAP